MRTFKHLLRIILAVLLTAYLLLLVAFNFGPAQRAVTRTVADVLAEQLHTRVHIDEVQVGLFNRVVLHGVAIDDQRGEPLLRARLMSAKIALRSLFAAPLQLRTVSLLDADISLYRTAAGQTPNFQFVIDAFSKPSTDKPSPLNLSIPSLILRRVNVVYDQRDVPVQPGRLQPAHLAFRNIDANLSLRHITSDSLHLRVRTFSFTERSGLRVEHLGFKLSADRRQAGISDFELRLPHSRWKQPSLSATYNATRSWADLWPTLRLRGDIRHFFLTLADLRAVAPLPECLQGTWTLEGSVDLRPDLVRVQRFAVSGMQGQVLLQGNARVQRQAGRFAEVRAEADKLQVHEQAMAHLLPLIPCSDTLRHMLQRGVARLEAQATLRYGKDGSGHARLTLHTPALTARAQALFSKGKADCSLHVDKLLLAHIAGNDRLPRSLNLAAQAKVGYEGRKMQSVDGSVQLSQIAMPHTTLSRLDLSGRYAADGAFRLKASSADPVASFTLSADGRMQGKRPTRLSVDAAIARFATDALGLRLGRLGSPTVHGQLHLHTTAWRGDIPQGSLSLSDVLLENLPSGEDYRLQQFTASCQPAAASGSHTVQVRSDFLRADLTGPLSVSSARGTLCALLQRALPTLPLGHSAQPLSAVWDVQATVFRTDEVRTLLGLDLDLVSPLIVKGRVDSRPDGRTALSVFTDGLRYGGLELANPSVWLEGTAGNLRTVLQAQKEMGGRPVQCKLQVHTADSLLHTAFTWKAEAEKRYDGAFKTTTRFLPTDGRRTDFRTDIVPTTFTLADTLWHIAAGTLHYTDKNLEMRHIALSRDDHSLHIDGCLSQHGGDSIVANLHKIDVAYVLGLVNFHAVEFGGLATGRAVITRTEAGPQVQSALHIPDFTFNHGPMGNSLVRIGWQPETKRILINADLRPPYEGSTLVDGYVSLADKGLDLQVLADSTDLRFLRRYMDGIFSDFNGHATGDCRIYGPFKQLDFSGRLRASASARIDVIGTSYKVSGGQVTLTPGSFRFDNFHVADYRHGTGRASGELRHDHLKNLRYDFQVQADKLLCYDRQQEPDMPFYATAYGTGVVRLQGSPGRVSADIQLRPEAGTTLVYPQSQAGSVSTDDAMVRFRSVHDSLSASSLSRALNPQPAAEPSTAATPPATESDILLNFLIDATPQAEVRIITDPRAGDHISAWGSGPIRATFYNKGAFRMYGTYTLERGTYKMSIQDIIRRDLTLTPGSRITFAGDAQQAALALRAVYTVNGVSLSELNYGAGFSRKTAKVDCILNIGGTAAAPQVNFDIGLQGISDDEKQMVRQLIATEEDMNRQAIYLLGIGRFYTAGATADIGEGYGSQQQSAAAMRSFLSTTLTSQLNNAISSALGSKSRWSFGANVAPGMEGWSDLEVDGLLQGRLFNDRLLFNGNFGYRDRPTYGSNFVGDFDLRYLLTPKGTVSLKAYSQTTDRYFTNSALTTQGIGINLQHDFRRFRDIFHFERRRTRKQKKAAEAPPAAKP